ncbi:MAG: AMP-binding protein [Deltaproteobacteria bacterium]|nr:AMP-binding protein [Deltaproteobacteria bacterium]
MDNEINNLILKLKKNDIHIWVDNGSLKYDSPEGSMNPELFSLLKENKEDLIDFINKKHNSPNCIIENIPTVETKESYEVSHGQRRLWFFEQFEEESIAYNISNAHILEGELDDESFRQAFLFLIERHESLRTVFVTKNEEPRQKILDNPDIAIEFIDLINAIDKEKKAKDLARKDILTPFDLKKGPLVSLSIIKLEVDKSLFLLNMHHIISDGWSKNIFIRDFLCAYNSFRDNKTPDLEPLRIQYKDYSAWQNGLFDSPEIKKQREYWLDKLSGQLPVLSIPTDKVRPLVKTFEGKSFDFTLSKEIKKNLNDLCKKNQITLFMMLQALVKVLFHRYSGQDDIILGSPIAGRVHKDLENQIGIYINTLVFRDSINGEIKFEEFLKTVSKTCTDGFDNQDYPFDKLVDDLVQKRDPSHSPLFDVMVVLQNYETTIVEIDGLKVSPFETENVVSKFDMILFFTEREDEILCSFEYNINIFNEDRIKRMAEHLKMLIYSVMENPQSRIKDLQLIPEKEKNLLLNVFNNTKNDYPADKTIIELFEEQADKTPDNIAVVFEDAKLCYNELNKKANKLAHLLKKKGVVPDTVIGILMDKSEYMIIGLLAILKAGGAYLPIDPLFPVERIMHMLRDSGARFLLSQSKNIKEVSYTKLLGLNQEVQVEIKKTKLLKNIKDFDSLPIPDRSLINLDNYRDKIGMASVTNSISIQSTRGCPYKCIYCHKVWSKNHVYRSADNIFNEVEFYYKKGVRNFEFIDDIFNLNKENSTRFFNLVIKNGLKINIFFPNGLRGDLLTTDYIDLMYEAGTRNINLSLETASPRLQKLIKKNLDIGKLKNALNYISNTYPDIILELASMHGFPTETEEEALLTLDFIKDIKWIHFPYIHILKIYPNTEMEELALKHGVLKQDIISSKNLAYHELPETLPFPKSFTRQYQSRFLNEYFFDKERLNHVWPIQNKILSREAIIQKYDAYLPANINSMEDIKEFLDIEDTTGENKTEDNDSSFSFFSKRDDKAEKKSGRRILFLDLSNHFPGGDELYGVAEQPLGLLYLLTHLKNKFKDEIDGKICKSGFDFNNYSELKKIVDQYKPELIGIRTLTYFKEFFHETVSLLKEWCPDVPLFAGGPYATSDYDSLLKDAKVDLAIIGEGEYVLEDLVGRMLKNNFKIPDTEILNEIGSLAYVEKRVKDDSREIILLDHFSEILEKEDYSNPPVNINVENLAYVMYTSGSTGLPKGVMIEHRQVNNCIFWMQEKFGLESNNTVLQRTSLTFDPSVWEIFWPLYVGARINLISYYQSIDPDFLIKFISENPDITIMYCPASLVNMMVHILKQKNSNFRIKLPYLIIGAESITQEVIDTFYQFFDGEIINTYGPTECTINNTYFDLERESTRDIVPIGYPVSNNKIYILSKDLSLLPVKQKGEICISGLSLARGYINNPEATKKNFIDNPYGPGKLYRTGDIGRWLGDGSVEISGRIDDQVKIRGYRIEPGEIENVLLKHDVINDCTVVVRNAQDDREETKICRNCGITSEYPNIQISSEGSCNVCSSLSELQQYNNDYFKALEDLDNEIKESNTQNKCDYDCILLYSGGRGAAYALYNLVERGHKVLALTYDNGYFTKSDINNIKKITTSLGVDHIVIKHKNSDLILKESLYSAKTVCNGCFHTSSSIGLEYAYKHGINIVIGATLSRGQIIENKLMPCYSSGTTSIKEIETELFILRQNTPQMNSNIFDLIDIDIVNDQSVFSEIRSLDFFRYCDVSNNEMIRYLNDKNPFWKSRKDIAIYSTNCPIKQIGDFCHLQDKSFHYYGSATSWEKRLNHISIGDLSNDLNCSINKKAFDNFSRRIGYTSDNVIAELDDYICAYYVSGEELDNSDIRKYLLKHLPEYSLPSYYQKLDFLPLSVNGKIDKKALPKPDRSISTAVEYVAPRNEIEKQLVEIWQEILKIEKIGISDNFFELGGHSLNAVQMVSRIKLKLLIDVKIKDLYEKHTICDLAEMIKSAESKELEFLENTEEVDNILAMMNK